MKTSVLRWAGRIVGIVVFVQIHQVAHMNVDSRQFAQRIGSQRYFIAKMLVAVKENAELHAPIAEMIVGDDVMAQEPDQLGK